MSAIKTLLSAASSLVLAACVSVGPDYDGPPAVSAGSFAADEAVSAGQTEPASAWWRALNDPALAALIDAAFTENRDLRVAAANVEASRAALRLARIDLRPGAEATADYQRRRLAGAGFGLDDARFDDTDYFDVGAGALWELDFFGRLRNSARAAFAEAERADYLRRDAEALVAAETARAYFDYRGAEIRLAVAHRNLAIQRETHQLTAVRFEEGMGTRLDVARAQSQAKATEALIPPLETARAAALNRLATLTGGEPDKVSAMLSDAPDEFAAPPATLAVGDVESLLRRRADIRAAERSLAAATARIGVAVADYFPRVTLIGAVSASAQSLSGVGGDGSLGYGVGPSLSWTGFDVPRVKAGVEAANARADAARAAYEKTVLEALEETRTAIVAYGRERARFDALEEAAKTAREAAALARARYDAGADDFIDVLDAESRQLSAEAALAESRAAVAVRYVDVYHALGAGWRAEGGEQSNVAEV